MEHYTDALYIWHGINHGFPIGWTKGTEPTFVPPPRIISTVEDEMEVTKWIKKRHDGGILLGPWPVGKCPIKGLHYSPLFTVPKPDGSSRIVAHLSYPRWGTSVNDCIDEAAKRVQYISLPEVARRIYNMGYDARIWVVDAKDAYYRVPIPSHYWRYMAIKWLGFVFVFTSLQMGLASACAIYQRFADAVLYIIKNENPKLFDDTDPLGFFEHYLDDFFGGHKDPKIAAQQVIAVWNWMGHLGISTRVSKVKFSYWQQIVLGWFYDTRARTFALPALKAIEYDSRITKLIRERQKGATKKPLEQLN